MTETLAEVRATHDYRIDRARDKAERAARTASAADAAYARCILERVDIGVLDDARAVKVQTAIAAAVATHELDTILDQASMATGRPR